MLPSCSSNSSQAKRDAIRGPSSAPTSRIPLYEVPEGQKTLDEVQKLTWFIPEQYAYEQLVQARDFYLLNLGAP